MKKLLAVILLFSLSVALLSGCAGKKASGSGDAEPVSESESTSTVPASESESEKDSATQISVDLSDVTGDFDEIFLSYISDRAEGNYMVSPLSFRYALGLLLAGAEGDTETELLHALGIASEEEWHDYAAAFSDRLAVFTRNYEALLEEYEYQKADGYLDADAEAPIRALRVANSVWKREDTVSTFKEDYQKTVSEVYSAEYEVFTPENAVEKINAWANEKTEGLIPSLLPDDYDTEHLAVVLMNALYFKDCWCNAFLPAGEGDFTTAQGETVKKDFMKQTERLSYYEDGDTQLVVLPMEGGVNMAFVLGDATGFSEKLEKAELREVEVTVPKLDLETSLSGGELTDFLKARGVQTAFTDSADFSRMTDTPVTVSDIVQKTRLKLDEEGVEAAAVTAIMDGATALPEKLEKAVFTADRPFSFYIYTRSEDTVFTLFAGEIVE